jgi:glycosyltransferase involved in cell wall biosynthesis
MGLPRILMIANYYPQVGGISSLVQNLSKGLIKNGYSVKIYPVGGPYVYRLFRYLNLFSVIKNFDIVHCHASKRLGFLPAFIGASVGEKLHKPLVLTYHSSPTTLSFVKNSSLVKSVIHKFAIITTPSEETASLFIQYGVKTVAIPNILDLDNWRYRERSKYKPYVVWTRNVYHPELAVEAFLLLKKEFPECSLTMCGKAANKRHLEKYQNFSGLHLLGFIPRNDLPKIMDKADVYINTMSHESFGYAVYEAMAMGLAIVSVPSSALSQWSGEKAITFSDAATPQALADALKKVIVDQDETKRKVQLGRQFVGDLTWDKLSFYWDQIYKYEQDIKFE